MTGRRYAQNTSVPVARSRAEVERLVQKHGATAYMTAWQKDRHVVLFEANGRRVRFDVQAPSKKEFPTTAKWEQEERRRWRVLVLLLKAKFELVASGDAPFDAEFLAYMVLPDQTTVGQKIIPELDSVARGARMPPLLPRSEE